MLQKNNLSLLRSFGGLPFSKAKPLERCEASKAPSSREKVRRNGLMKLPLLPLEAITFGVLSL